MHRTLAVCLAFLAAPALAADWNIRPWDTELSVEDVTKRIHGQSIAFPDGAVARYAPDGSYSYTYVDGNAFEGSWEMAEDGSVCTTFTNGFSRCDLFVLQGDQLMLINEDGGRFLTAE